MDAIEAPLARGERERLPATRESVTYKLRYLGPWGAWGVHVTLGAYPDGRLGEVFVCVSKTGSALRTALEAWAMTASKLLQHGASAADLARAVGGLREGEGAISCEALPAIHGTRACSIWDLISRVLRAATDHEGRVRDLLEVEERPT